MVCVVVDVTGDVGVAVVVTVVLVVVFARLLVLFSVQV